MAQKQTGPEARALRFEYVASAVSLLKGDAVVVHVVNDSAFDEVAHTIIYQNTGAGAVVATDSGHVTITPSWTWGLGFTISESGEYWLRIRVTSEYLIPKASFERLRDGGMILMIVLGCTRRWQGRSRAVRR